MNRRHDTSPRRDEGAMEPGELTRTELLRMAVRGGAITEVGDTCEVPARDRCMPNPVCVDGVGDR